MAIQLAQEKVQPLSVLMDWVKDQKARGQTTVTTNGCFDILHLGHLRYLELSRQQGDGLLVLVNSDQSVRRLKGPKRPIIPDWERAELLAGLACVNFVGIFDQDTPLEWLMQIQPDVHVKGNQYDEVTLPEAEPLRSIGCRLFFAPMVDGHSTSDVIKTIESRMSFQDVCKP